MSPSSSTHLPTSSPRSSKVPQVSVVLPCYQGERFLKATLTMLLQQTLRDIEIIVIHDGCTDSSIDIALEIANRDDRIRVYETANQGGARARNFGVSKAKADLIAFIDHDDFWNHRKLEHQVEALQANPEAIATYSWTLPFNEQGVYKPVPHQAEGNVFETLMQGNFLESGSNLMVRKAAFDAVGGFEHAFTNCCDDWALALRLANYGPFCVVKKPDVYYRLLIGSSAHNMKAMREKTFRLLSQWMPYSEQSSESILSAYYVALAVVIASRGQHLQESLRVLWALGMAFHYKPSLLFKEKWYRTQLKQGIQRVLTTPLPKATMRRWKAARSRPMLRRLEAELTSPLAS